MTKKEIRKLQKFLCVVQIAESLGVLQEVNFAAISYTVEDRRKYFRFQSTEAIQEFLYSKETKDIQYLDVFRLDLKTKGVNNIRRYSYGYTDSSRLLSYVRMYVNVI